MKQKIIKVGNSAAVFIPKDFLNQMGWKLGDEISIDIDRLSETVYIYKTDQSNRKPSRITPELFQYFDDINRRYGSALRELVKR